MIKKVSSDQPKVVDSEAVLLVVNTKLASSIQRVSGDFDISLSSVVRHLHDISKSIRSWRFVPHVTKILQNF